MNAAKTMQPYQFHRHDSALFQSIDPKIHAARYGLLRLGASESSDATRQWDGISGNKMARHRSTPMMTSRQLDALIQRMIVDWIYEFAERWGAHQRRTRPSPK
jgi:hypothetical protein